MKTTAIGNRGPKIAAVALAFALSACGGGQDDGPVSPPSAAPIAAPVTATPKSIDFGLFRTCDADCLASVTKYRLTEPAWNSHIVHDEPVLPSSLLSHLWREPLEILQVRDRITGHVYTPWVDYAPNANGLLYFPAGSTVQLIPAGFPYQANPEQSPTISQTKDGRPLWIKVDYQQRQVAVTYRATVDAPAPKTIGSVPVTAAKVNGCNPVAVTFYGDSITNGGDATALSNIEPRQPGWVDLLASMLANGCGDTYHWRNASQGGWSSTDGLQNISARVNQTASDMVVLGFGMNDSTAFVPPALFESNMRAMVTSIRAQAPATEILLVSSWLGNPEWKPMDVSLLQAYQGVLVRIAGDTAGVAVADMTSMSASVLAKKRYYEVTSNGVNHPNDFMHVLYAQVVREALR